MRDTEVRIVRVALRNQYKKVRAHSLSVTHDQLIAASERRGLRTWSDAERGFTDSDGDFWTEEEAAFVAFEAGQIAHWNPGQKLEVEDLK
jgi:hypothetical protein